MVQRVSHGDTLAEIGEMPICSDGGRVQAWLRSGLNEGMLRPYVESFWADPSELANFYGSGAFVRDRGGERPEMVCALLQQLEAHTFRLGIGDLCVHPEGLAAGGAAPEGGEGGGLLSGGAALVGSIKGIVSGRDRSNSSAAAEPAAAADWAGLTPVVKLNQEEVDAGTAPGSPRPSSRRQSKTPAKHKKKRSRAHQRVRSIGSEQPATADVVLASPTTAARASSVEEDGSAAAETAASTLPTPAVRIFDPMAADDGQDGDGAWPSGLCDPLPPSAQPAPAPPAADAGPEVGSMDWMILEAGKRAAAMTAQQQQRAAVDVRDAAPPTADECEAAPPAPEEREAVLPAADEREAAPPAIDVEAPAADDERDAGGAPSATDEAEPPAVHDGNATVTPPDETDLQEQVLATTTRLSAFFAAVGSSAVGTARSVLSSATSAFGGAPADESHAVVVCESAGGAELVHYNDQRTLQLLTGVLTLCPERGLGAQRFQCAGEGCSSPIGLFLGKARICDYDGLYYCAACHAGDLRVVPARAIHSWDFERRAVSRQAAAMLDFIRDQPVFNMRATNPTMFGYVEELREAGDLRERLVLARRWMEAEKPEALEQVRAKLWPREYLWQDASLLALRDLEELAAAGPLLPMLRAAAARCDGVTGGAEGTFVPGDRDDDPSVLLPPAAAAAAASDDDETY